MPIDRETMSGLYRSIFQSVFEFEYAMYRNRGFNCKYATADAARIAIIAVEHAEEEGLL